MDQAAVPTVIAVLEDDARRTQAMIQELRERLPEVPLLFFDTAPDLIAWLEDNLATVQLLCLDHDLGPDRRRDGRRFDPGVGRDVVEVLVRRQPSCPVLIHSSNTEAAQGMQLALEAAGWLAERVSPFDDLAWVKARWSERVVDVTRRRGEGR